MDILTFPPLLPFPFLKILVFIALYLVYLLYIIFTVSFLVFSLYCLQKKVTTSNLNECFYTCMHFTYILNPYIYAYIFHQSY